jgi:predicted aspartyl protease
MGKVVEKIQVVNWDDIAMIAGGARKAAPRSVEAEALVDTGAGMFYLQSSLVKKLGLRQIDTVRSRTMSNLLEERRVCSPVELCIAGRKGIFPVVEVPDALPNLIGQIPLEALDLVLNPRKGKVGPNPEHPDGPLYDEF